MVSSYTISGVCLGNQDDRSYRWGYVVMERRERLLSIGSLQMIGRCISAFFASVPHEIEARRER